MKNVLLSAALALALSGSAFAAPITYSVNRTIGAGTVVGTVQTDGTIGVLSSANILSWSLTLSAPSLNGGSPDTFAGTGSTVVGSALTGDLTDLEFDFSVGGAGFALQGGASFNAWCMAAAGISCAGEATPAESIFFSSAGGPAETEARSGTVVIGAAAVPVPATLALVGLALLAAGGATRRRSAA